MTQHVSCVSCQDLVTCLLYPRGLEDVLIQAHVARVRYLFVRGDETWRVVVDCDDLEHFARSTSRYEA
jgi:hypothetical protein